MHDQGAMTRFQIVRLPLRHPGHFAGFVATVTVYGGV